MEALQVFATRSRLHATSQRENVLLASRRMGRHVEWGCSASLDSAVSCCKNKRTSMRTQAHFRSQVIFEWAPQRLHMFLCTLTRCCHSCHFQYNECLNTGCKPAMGYDATTKTCLDCMPRTYSAGGRKDACQNCNCLVQECKTLSGCDSTTGACSYSNNSENTICNLPSGGSGVCLGGDCKGARYDVCMSNAAVPRIVVTQLLSGMPLSKLMCPSLLSEADWIGSYKTPMADCCLLQKIFRALQ